MPGRSHLWLHVHCCHRVVDISPKTAVRSQAWLSGADLPVPNQWLGRSSAVLPASDIRRSKEVGCFWSVKAVCLQGLIEQRCPPPLGHWRIRHRHSRTLKPLLFCNSHFTASSGATFMGIGLDAQMIGTYRLGPLLHTAVIDGVLFCSHPCLVVTL